VETTAAKYLVGQDIPLEAAITRGDHHMSKRIAIVGAGTAGLHLGLYLQQKGVQSTIFTDTKIEAIRTRGC
jgi:NADPH-dependent glutamate synthase beta subunit-like oxidoreductase